MSERDERPRPDFEHDPTWRFMRRLRFWVEVTLVLVGLVLLGVVLFDQDKTPARVLRFAVPAFVFGTLAVLHRKDR